MTTITSPPASAEFHVGTLSYTRSTLTTLFIWLLWGDFCFQLMEMVILQVLPLKLQSLNASNTLMGVIVITIPGVMNLAVVPVVGYRSDRYRSRYGRRLPFLFWSTPPLALCLILLGCSDSVGHWLQAIFRPLAALSPATIVLGLIVLFVIGFQGFNAVVNSVYYYLFNDVVPESLMGRFLGLFRVVASVMGSLFAFLVFRHAEDRMRQIFIGAAVLYFTAFMLMCWKVKEGGYPPPRDSGTRRSLIAIIRAYGVECFSHRFYWDFFLSQTFYAIAGCAAPFMIFLYLSVNLTLARIGIVLGWMQIIALLLSYPAGALTDRIHPMRLMLLSTGLLVISSSLGLIWLFIHPSSGMAMGIYGVYALFYVVVSTLYSSANLPMSMRLLPKAHYGQFCSANALVRSLAVILATPVLGFLLDTLKQVLHGNSFYYRYAPIWTVAFQALSLVFLYRVYQYWRRHGADESFSPPRVSSGDAAHAE